jgi:hypothetical protein
MIRKIAGATAGKALVAMLVGLCAIAALTAGEAKAYYPSEIGPVGTAEVSCDANTHTIEVRPHVGAGAAYQNSSQWVATKIWIKNARTNKWFVATSSDGTGWTWLRHTPATTIFINEMIGSSTTYTKYVTDPIWVSQLVDYQNVWPGDTMFYIAVEYGWWTSTGFVRYAYSFTTYSYGTYGRTGMPLPYCQA